MLRVVKTSVGVQVYKGDTLVATFYGVDAMANALTFIREKNKESVS